MKLVSNEKTEQNTVTLKFTIAKDVFDAQTEKVYNRKKNKITIQGFRPGKAPRHMIEKIYGKGVFYEDALNDLLPGEYAEALKESGIKAVAQPEIDVESIDENGVLVVAKVTVKPEVEIEGYTGIALSKETVKVTEKEVEEELENVRSRQGREIEVTDRPAKNGDTANIDYEGFADGVAFEGGKAEKQDLKLGSNTFIPGFEDQVIGHSVGDEFEIQVTFPTEYHAPELAGKDATFKIKLNGLKYTELPEVDDEFAKDVSEFDTLAEYKADLKAKIQKRKEAEADRVFEGKLADALVEKLEVALPEAMVNAEAENMLRDYDMNLRQNGLDLKTYLKYTGKELNDLREDFKPRAEKQLKLRLALEKIAQKENLSVTEEEIKKEIADLAAAYNMSADDVKAYVAKEDLENDLLSRKAMDLVKSTAKKPRASKKKASTEEPAGEQPAENKENKAE
ncbi:MAG: trigger factor [Clostridiales bacterium]|nr:trigger factor [Clostridiales bacterium]HCH68743.1 trigger factor [Clostridiales bacterium]